MAATHPVLTRKAVEVGHDLTTAGYGFDPTTILTIIAAVVQLFQGCKLSPKAAARRAQKPRFLDKVRLRDLIGQHGTAAANPDAVEAAVLDAGSGLTEADVKAMYEELK